MKYLRAWLKGVGVLLAILAAIAAVVGIIYWPTLLPSPWDLIVFILWGCLLLSGLIGSLYVER